MSELKIMFFLEEVWYTVQVNSLEIVPKKS